jgi:hypothetical protein
LVAVIGVIEPDSVLIFKRKEGEPVDLTEPIASVLVSIVEVKAAESYFPTRFGRISESRVNQETRFPRCSIFFVEVIEVPLHPAVGPFFLSLGKMKE